MEVLEAFQRETQESAAMFPAGSTLLPVGACTFDFRQIWLGESLSGTLLTKDGGTGTACKAVELFTQPYSQLFSEAENQAMKK